jgi:hypothetical protein
MKALLLLFVMLIGYTVLQAQDSTLVIVKAGNRVQDVLSPADMYSYPQFTNGKVFFRDGRRAAANLNYNRLFGQMLFISQKGDTLAVADELTIKFIAIGQDTFYYDEGFIRLIMNKAEVKLAEKQIWVVADVRKIGTHNRPTSTVAVTSISSYADETARAKSYDFILSEDIVMRKEIQYYFGDKYNHFVRAGKNKLLLLLPKEQRRIENYLKANKVNFDNRDDLEKLVQFIGQPH